MVNHQRGCLRTQSVALDVSCDSCEIVARLRAICILLPSVVRSMLDHEFAVLDDPSNLVCICELCVAIHGHEPGCFFDRSLLARAQVDLRQATKNTNVMTLQSPDRTARLRFPLASQCSFLNERAAWFE